MVGSTNIAMAEGFKSLGYEVDEYNYRTELKKRGTNGMHHNFLNQFLVGRQYDLQVYCKTNQMSPQILDMAKGIGPTWYWFMDNFEACRSINAAGYAANATFASATASDVAHRFGMINNNSYHIFEGYNPDVYYYEDLPKIHDFIFIGNATVPRVVKLQDLRSKGMDISIFGYGWPIGMKANGPVFDEDERIEINSSKVVLNLCHDDVIFSDRVTKALACGANVISQSCVDLKEFAGWLPRENDGYNPKETDWIGFSSNWGSMGFPVRIQQHVIGKEISRHMKHHHSWKAVAAGMIEKVRMNESTVR